MPKVLFSSEPSGYRITLHDPPLNILDIEMLGELRDALARVREDRQVLVIDAAGDRAFSAGASVQDHLPERIETMLSLFHDCFRILMRLDLVSVALVRGPALGGGSELALACDFVLAGDSARFGQPEIHLGVFAPVASLLLPRQTHPRRALELLLTGDPIEATEAERLGLVNAVFPDAGFERQAAAWLERIQRQSASTLRLAKRAFRLAAADELDQRLEAEAGVEGRVGSAEGGWRLAVGGGLTESPATANCLPPTATRSAGRRPLSIPA
jgi:cyclohexa-1,5-dienecarbonyl-CoA hydratase